MSEGKGDSPHGKGPYGSPEQRDLLGGINLPAHRTKKPDMIGLGLFDLPNSQLPLAKEPITQVATELEPRRLKFRAGTKLYKVVRDSEGKPKIPRDPMQAADLFDKELTVPAYFDIPVEYLEKGKRGGTITKKVGQSEYGAFTIVLSPVRLKSGRFVLEERLASYNTRSSKRKL